MRYLDPKADLTFKKVFGEHKDLLISLLNALLPFESADEAVTEVEYLPAEMVPDNPLRKNSIVDVRCKDNRGRQFIVEMQMVWSKEFKRRVFFDASKAYVRQLGEGRDYKLLEPVYSLNLVNEIFEPDMGEYYHYYHMVHSERPDKVIDGLHLVFVELPKFTPHSYSERKMQVLWLRYLTEINDQTRNVPEDLLANPDIRKAVTEIEESAFTDAELLGYDKFWDTIRMECTLVNSVERRYKEGRTEGRAEGLAEGLEKGKAEGLKRGKAEGLAEGERINRLATARKMKVDGFPPETIAKYTGLSTDEIGTFSKCSKNISRHV